MTVRTSLTHPLQIAELRTGPGAGRIGVTFAPGKHQQDAFTGAWARDLALDLDAIVAWGARALVTLVEARELAELKIADLGVEAERRGLEWLHLPIRDYGVPGPAAEARWPEVSAHLHARLAAGEDIVVHCKGGLGRAGMVAARLLTESGVDPEAAISQVRAARGEDAIETEAQAQWARRGALTRPPAST
jgi:protein-tyrosine phosphatase